MPDSLTGYSAALGATMLWAGNFVAARAVAWLIPPCQFNFWRWVIALIAILPFALPHLRHDWPHFRQHFGYLTFMAFVGVTLMNTFIYKAGQTTESLNMALLMPATPILVLILARIVYGEPISKRRLCGMFIAMAGILVLISRGDWQRLIHLEIMGGDLWTMGCMICFAIYSLFMRQRPKEITPSGFNLFVFSLGIIYAIPFIAVEMWLLPLPQFGVTVTLGILYSGLGCSAAAFWLWTLGIDRIGPVKAAIIYYSLPLFAVIMAKIVLDENIVQAQAIGGLLIIGGIFTATWPGKVKE